MRKKVLFLIILTFVCTSAKALTYGGCEYSDVSRMKSIINNINISYDYHIDNNQALFDVTINNITKDVYFVDTRTNTCYYYADSQSGEITIKNYTGGSGKYKFYSTNSSCYGLDVGIKYYSFPTYNTYSSDDICNDIPGFGLCNRWGSVSYTYEEFKSLAEKYKESLNKNEDSSNDEAKYNPTFLDKIAKLYINYYYYFLGSIILICLTIIFIKRRKDKYKL